MMVLSLLIYMLSPFSSLVCNSAHDVPIATFTIYVEGDEIALDIVCDHEALLSSLSHNNDSLTLQSVRSYFHEHLSISINGDTSNIELVDIKNKQDHLFIKAKLEHEASEIKTIRLTNTCLIGIDNQSNIIQLKLNGDTRDYRMHADRTMIEVEY